MRIVIEQDIDGTYSVNYDPWPRLASVPDSISLGGEGLRRRSYVLAHVQQMLREYEETGKDWVWA